MISRQIRTLISLAGDRGQTERAYAEYGRHPYRIDLMNAESSLNEGLERIIRSFNDMYDRDRRSYGFRFSLEPGKI